MLIPFRKMQAQGNDFAILELLGAEKTSLPLAELARDICARRKGVGADGLVALLSDPQAAARMLIFNSDGSRAAMCGSALRCCAYLLNGLTGKAEFRINTDSGIKEARIMEAEIGKCVEVDLGKPRLVERDIEVEGISGSLVDVGNLHFVSYCADPKGLELRWGPILESHPRFPGGVNVHFVRAINRGKIAMRIWERGAGATQACGTGAVASVFLGIELSLLDSVVAVSMPGGDVQIERTKENSFLLRGAVADVFSGVYRWTT